MNFQDIPTVDISPYEESDESESSSSEDEEREKQDKESNTEKIIEEERHKDIGKSNSRAEQVEPLSITNKRVKLVENEWDVMNQQFTDWLESQKKAREECISVVEEWLSDRDRIRISQEEDEDLGPIIQQLKSTSPNRYKYKTTTCAIHPSQNEHSMCPDSCSRFGIETRMGNIGRHRSEEEYSHKESDPAGASLLASGGMTCCTFDSNGKATLITSNDNNEVNAKTSTVNDQATIAWPAQCKKFANSGDECLECLHIGSEAVDSFTHPKVFNSDEGQSNNISGDLDQTYLGEEGRHMPSRVKNTNIQHSFQIFNHLLVRVTTIRVTSSRSKNHLQTPTIQLVIPKAWQIPLSVYIHSSRIFSHFGVSRTLQMLRIRYFWKNMRETVKVAIETCEICQKKKIGPRLYHGNLRSLTKNGPWDTVGIDIFGPLPQTVRRQRWIIVCIDHFTKWVELTAVTNIKSETVAEILHQLVTRFGCPRRILTDRGAQFISRSIRDLCYILGLKKVFTSAYRPQSDGIAEAFMKVLGSQLSSLVEHKPKSWHLYLAQIAFAYRITPHPSTGETPFFLMYGYDPRLPDQTVLEDLTTQSFLNDWQKDARDRLLIVKQTRQLALEYSIMIQVEYEKRFSRRIQRQEQYEVGQLILVKTPPATLQNQQGRKLLDKYIGPFRVTACLDNGLTYHVVSIEDGKERLVHVQNSRPFLAVDYCKFNPSIPQLVDIQKPNLDQPGELDSISSSSSDSE